MVSLTERIRQKALAIGFSKVGFAKAETLTDEAERLRRWLERGLHGEMEWLARAPEKRTDPRSVFADARSVISLALNYYTPHRHDASLSSGKISRYAWGDDYHDVMRSKLAELLDFALAERPGSTGRSCVDTAPVTEKAWATRAGLGWIGKNANLITSDFGSWVFLGEIFVDFELDYDAPFVEDHCGTCTACIEACPTDAIIDGRMIDSNRCISHATIEVRAEALPESVAAKMSGWLYGCDICQEVCPWNHREKPSDVAAFAPRNGETELELERVFELTPETYAARFRRSAMKRAKLAGLRRNARHLAADK